jgi:hypothetical protein
MESQNQNYITIVMIVYIILFSFSTDRMIHVIYLFWIRTMILSLYEICIKSIK